MTGENWEALAAAVKARRELLRLPQQLIGHGGPGEMTMRKIERAEATAIRNRTKSQLEHALRWPEGVVDKILNGTATQEEIDDVVVRGRAEMTLPAPTAHLKSGGGAGIVTGSGRADLGFAAHAQGQVIRPDSVPSRARVGEPVVHVGNLSDRERSEQLARLESGTFDVDREIFKAANHLAGLLVDRHPSTPATRSTLTKLVELMQEIAGDEGGDDQ